MSKLGALQTLLEAARPLAVNARSMVGDIAQLRGSRGILPAMQNIYDNQLYKQFYKPLDDIGIPMKENNAGYRSIELPPDVKDGLNNYGLPFKDGGEVTIPNKLKEFYDAWRESVASAAQDYTMPFESNTYNNQDASQSPRMGPTGSTIYSKSRYAQGGEVVPPYQPSKMNNTFMAGGLNIINPKNKNKGPLNIQYNANNLLAKARTL